MTAIKEISPEDWTLEKIKELSFQEQMELYKTLPSADFEEMDGDYDSCMVGYISETEKKPSLWWLHESEKGNWRGKSFSPTKGNQKFHSEGYNRWEIDGKEVHHMRFHTDMVESLIDGKITFRLKYALFKNDGGIVDMTDEVRRVKKGLYLCVGMSGPVKLPPAFFCLTGPVHEYDHSSVWIYGDEVKEHANIKVTPYAEWLKKQK